MPERYRLTRPNGRVLTFDAVLRLTITHQNRVTDHPIESGSPVSDHIQALPLEITLLAVTTESPLDWQSAEGGPGHVNAALAFFEAARFETLVLSGPRLPRGQVGELALVRWPYDLTSKRGVRPTILLRQIKKATGRQVRIAVSQPVVTEDFDGANELADEVDLGEQPTETLPDDARAEQDQSILSSWTDWLFGEG
ncbi:MAG: phage baseplate protein [Myxococcota bacterium]